MSTTADHIAEAAHEAGVQADAALRRRASQLQKFCDDVEDLVRRVAGTDDSDLSRLRDRVAASIDQVRAAARDGARVAVQGTRKAALATDRYVHDKPWVALGATAVAGVLLGALMRGGSRE